MLRQITRPKYPNKVAQPKGLSAICALSAIILVGWLVPQAVLADTTASTEAWRDELWKTVWDPWFVFGMSAQGLFFLRFVLQWIVSERQKKSTIPIGFWYLSLAGAVATFVYACHEAQPVFMIGQLLACVIYIRNLMLIRAHRLREGCPAQPETTAGLSDEIGDEALVDDDT